MNSKVLASRCCVGLLKSLALVALTSVSFIAEAGLVNRGAGMIYDTDFNITWLQNWNQGAGSGYDPGYDDGYLAGSGRMTWANAMDWAENLTWGGYSDWRLPEALKRDGTGPCGAGYNCAGNEMGHLWYVELGNTIDRYPGDTGPFVNMQTTTYWTRTELASSSNSVWVFGIGDGIQHEAGKDFVLYAVAVRDGDVASASVPEPHALELALLVVGAWALVGRRRQ